MRPKTVLVSAAVFVWISGSRMVLAADGKSGASESQAGTASQSAQTSTDLGDAASKNGSMALPTLTWQHGLSVSSQPPKLEKANEESKQLVPSSGSSRWFKSSPEGEAGSSSKQAANAPVQPLKTAAKTGKPRVFVSGVEKPKPETPSQPLSDSSASSPSPDKSSASN